MNIIKVTLASIALTAAAASPVWAKDDKAVHAITNEEYGIPVFANDIEDKPYVIVAGIEAGIRKATIFSKAASEKKIYNELWERAEKVDADAVVLAAYGKSKISAFSWGRTGATGIAIRFLTDDEIAKGVQGERAADFDPKKHKTVD